MEIFIFYLLPKIKFIANLSNRQSCCLCLYFHYIHLLVDFLIFLLSATYGKCSLFSRPHLNSTDLSVQQTRGRMYEDKTIIFYNEEPILLPYTCKLLPLFFIFNLIFQKVFKHFVCN